MTRLLFLELNEINFEQVKAYTKRGQLPVLAKLIRNHGVSETTSERKYEHLEPWIQWVTAHTGLTFSEHGIFRLGDIVEHDIPQIWEALESQGLKVGAVSPMNAKNRCRDAAFFIPDPWTETEITAPAILKKLYGAVSQAVNDNAQARVTLTAAAWLTAGALFYARPVNYARYIDLAGAAFRRRPWAKALILDQLLADVFVKQVRRTRPDFASLFLNAGAHIQHHYMFNSAVYDGPFENPEWYIPPGEDPVRDVYALYDRLVGQIEREFPEVRLMLATGLHQNPHQAITFYWRLKDHADFLRRLGITFTSVEPRMSRDFLVTCASHQEAAEAERCLDSVRGVDGTPLFEVDNRGADLFVMLAWSQDIDEGFDYIVGSELRSGFRDDVAFVAIKNGEHDGVGYLVDTALSHAGGAQRLALDELPRIIAEACGVDWNKGLASTA